MSISPNRGDVMFVWQAHEGAVSSLAFGPGAQFLVSASADEQVKVWEPFTGAEQFRVSLRPRGGTKLPGRLHSAPHGLAVSADARTAVVAYLDYEIVFVGLEFSEIILRRSYEQVLAVKPSPDGLSCFALVAGPDHICQLRFADGEQIAASPCHDDRRFSFGVAPDCSRIVVGGSFYPWPPNPLRPRLIGVRMKNTVAVDLAFSADNEHLFALVGGKVVVYSLFSGLFKTKLKGHCGPITAMQLSPDGRRLWTASRDATVKCWDTFSLTLDRTFRFNTGGLDCLAVSPDGNVAAVGSGQKGTITVWDLG